uniref:Uncharacterized protein n=1 Tax=Anopheles maculatus TaxID=74869 RepID=A0A182SZ50_9DIPT
IIPCVQSADSAETREFLNKIAELLVDYVNIQNDRKEKILDFHHPEDMKKLLTLDIPEDAVTLQQLVKDCAMTLKYQVKTGEWRVDGTTDTIKSRPDCFDKAAESLLGASKLAPHDAGFGYEKWENK